MVESLPSYELWPWGQWGGPRGLALGCVQLRRAGSLVGWAPSEFGLRLCRQESLLTGEVLWVVGDW